MTTGMPTSRTRTTSRAALPGFYDIALRDFGLLVAAVALARLAVTYAPARAT